MFLFLALTFVLSSFAQTLRLPEAGNALAARDAQGNLWALSSTRTAGLPTTPNAVQKSFGGGDCVIQGFRFTISSPCTDLYLQKYSPDGTTLLAATYLGGTRDEAVGQLHLDADGCPWIALTSESPSFLAIETVDERDRAVLVKLSADLTEVQLKRRFEINGYWVDLLFTVDGIFAGAQAFSDGAFRGTLLSISPAGLNVRWRSVIDKTSGGGLLALTRLSGGDLLGVMSSTTGTPKAYRVLSGDGGLVAAKESGEQLQVASAAPLPGDAFVIGGTRGPAFAPRSFYRRYNANLEPVEEAQSLGSSVLRLTASEDGLVGIWGNSPAGLATTSDAPFRCRNGGSLFYAELPFAEGTPDFVTYLGETASSTLPSIIAGAPVLLSGTELSFAKPPQKNANAKPCLDYEVQSYAKTLGRDSFTSDEDLLERKNAAPGELLTVFGAGFAEDYRLFQPEKLGVLPIEVEGTKFFVDGILSGILELGPNRATLAIPYSIEGKESVDLVWERNRERLGTLRLQVLRNAAIALVERNPVGDRLGVYVNGTLSSEDNPVYPGDEVSVYALGAGPLDLSVDARVVVSGGQLPRAASEVRADVTGAGLQVVTYAGTARGQLPGLMQVNATIAADLRYSGRQTLSLLIGDRIARAVFWLKQR